MNHQQWIRVTKKNRCPACGKDTWCILNPGLTPGICICMRVQSQKPKQFKDGSLGWIHPLDPNLPVIPHPKPTPSCPAVNCGKLIAQWSSGTTPEQLLQLSQQLKVSINSLSDLQVCWSPEHHAWAIPMRSGYGDILGIRLRANNGEKWAVRGSHSGCFIPSRTRPQPLALVVEGATDTAAGLDLGFYTVGRPAAFGGVDHLKHLFRLKGVKRAAICCDNDAAGIAGAHMASKHLGVPSCLIVTPCKDIRAFKAAGGDKPLLDSLINQSIWNTP